MASHSISNPLSLQMLTTFLILLSFPLNSMCLKVEKQALMEIKKQLIDPLNYLESWKDSDSDSDSPCRFYGVLCDQETGLVTEISLDNKSLSGTISPSISALKNLTSLVLPYNRISGALPTELQSCVNLKKMNVSGNYLNGTVPDLSSLKNLEVLDLCDNDFTGPFPAWLGNLTSLTSLSLGDNDFDEGEIPDTIGNLRNLYYLFLAGSNLRGEIPESLSGLEALGTLDICRNKISGEFPRWIDKLKNLFKIELYLNNLTGTLPDRIADLTLLQEFDISVNQLSGEIPRRMGNLTRLTIFHVFRNNFSGEIPAGFGEMRNLVSFGIYMNRFTGLFPPNLGRYSPLNSIDISQNGFSGPLPKYLCQLGSLKKLLAIENEFSGGFPENYADCPTLQRLRVSSNRLEGPVSSRVWALPNVHMMDFSNNNFSGGISGDHIGVALQLQELILSNNGFSGELPKELGKASLIERISLSNNKFSGKIPPELGGLKQITSIQMDSNKFTGSIPPELATCPRLVDLNLASNFLTGQIPSVFSKMTSLNALNLSRNGLTGSIPSGFDKLRLSLVDLSYNRLSGKVPPYFLSIASDKALFGNRNLCIEENESTKRFVNSNISFCDGKISNKSFFKSKVVIYCTILLVLVVILLGLMLVSSTNSERAGPGRCFGPGKGNSPPNWRLESFQKNEFELDADEICQADEENLIGCGSTGKVYRLDLRKGGGTLAVKQLWKGSGIKLIEAEMKIMGNIRHRNILKLYACLTRESSHYLVFEYMANGNLFRALRGVIKFGRPELDWCQRYKIGLGAAKGLAYLHHDCSPAIIHRDIKSTNILLDDDYEAKIADFGVAKVVDNVSPNRSEMSCFTGTHGYIAPEMAYSLKLTEKSDVYSFGVVLLELVTGKGAVEDEYGEGKDIVYYVSTHLDTRENIVRKVLDQKVVSEQVQDDMIKVLKIAIRCTAKLPNLRPSMKEVVKMLVDAEPAGFKSADDDFAEK
ncbi:Leucine-rich receptor-like protein kinase family protein [Striga hermonthica]|uniref:Leucine-rich receptor-like protein kinase family protein n=1 Tax=Striga hermonthica TaxID=68872 RepID=A0A9N7R431_STRHE|nr:Leucine-rich receptor-like protein kinase family protein [Striga hermonthica]